MPVDMHAHWIPKDFANIFRQRSKAPRLFRDADGREIMDSGFTQNPVPDAFDDPRTRIAEMDKNGITRGVLSLTPFLGIETMPLEESLPMCRTYNDAVSEMCAKWPDRFSAMAALPSVDFDAMLAEFERAMSLPGMVGGVLPGDGFLTEKRARNFDAVLKAADRRNAIMLVHYAKWGNDPAPIRIDASDNQHARIGSLDMQSKLSQNMVTFCMTDFLGAYPNMTMMSHNLGGNIAFEIERMDHRSIIDRPKDELPSRRIRAGRVLVDCNSLGSRAIELAVETYGADKIVMGSDGTAFGMTWTMKAVAEAKIGEKDKELIKDGNAVAALGRVKTARLSAAAE